MPNLNTALFMRINKYFNPTSNKDPEWTVLFPVIEALQKTGLNEMNARGQNNPFATRDALEHLRTALLQDGLRQRLFPNLSTEHLRNKLNQLTLDGPPDVQELYSICAKKLIDMNHQQGIWTPEMIVLETEKRLASKPETSTYALINGMLPMDASHVYQYYAMDARCGPLNHDNAKKIFHKHIEYQQEEEALEIVRAALEDNPTPDITASDRHSLLMRVKDRLNFLHSKQDFDRLYHHIQGLNSELDLNAMEHLLQQALTTSNPRENPYNKLHFIINGELQSSIRQRRNELHHTIEVKKNPLKSGVLSNTREEQELPSTSEWVHPATALEKKQLQPFEQELPGVSEWLYPDDTTPVAKQPFVPINSAPSSPETLSTLSNSLPLSNPSSPPTVDSETTEVEKYRAPQSKKGTTQKTAPVQNNVGSAQSKFSRVKLDIMELKTHTRSSNKTTPPKP